MRQPQQANDTDSLEPTTTRSRISFSKRLSMPSFFTTRSTTTMKRGNSFKVTSRDPDCQQQQRKDERRRRRRRGSGKKTATTTRRGTFMIATNRSGSLSSFLFGSNNKPGIVEAASTENAFVEIQRAIDTAQWQEVYCLAFNIGAEVPLPPLPPPPPAPTTTETNTIDGEGSNQEIGTRSHLQPEDAERAGQLDKCLQAGDWNTLAARAAVFSALAQNSVGSINFVGRT